MSQPALQLVSAPATPPEFSVRFWGVRGSVPSASQATMRYGGNTACVELCVGGKRLIFDAGTGLRVLGEHLVQAQKPIEAYLFFTHTHWDRIQGFPFFVPAFIEGNCFHIYGAASLNNASIKQRLHEQMLRPNFPVPLHAMRSNLKFHDITPGSTIAIDDIAIETVLLNPHSRALGYRITWNHCTVVYATDADLHDPHDPTFLHFAQDADLLIFDTALANHAYFDPHAAAETRNPDTWRACVDLAIEAKVKQMVMFHHDPTHEDDFLDQIEAEVQAVYPHAQLAREGMVLNLSAGDR